MAKIFHTGDFHLDSPFSGLDFSRSEEARKARCALFEKMMASAKDEGCDMVLISGDLFDSSYVTPETGAAIIRAFGELGCPVVISPGNHDPYTEDSFYATEKLPANVHIFKSENLEPMHFPHLGISVFGYAFRSDSHPGTDLTSFPDISAGSFATKILLAHCDLDTRDSKYAPLDVSDLAGTGIIFAALGHVHKEPQIISRKGTHIGYCGFPEGRGFDELGRGGAWIVDIDTRSGGFSAVRKTFSQKHFEIETVDVTGITDAAALSSLIACLCAEKGYDSRTSLRVVLRGLMSADFGIDESLLRQLVMKTNQVGYLEIKDETIPDFSESALKNDLTIRGEVYKALSEELSSKDAAVWKKAKEALNIALRVLAEDYDGLGAGIYENFRY